MLLLSFRVSNYRSLRDEQEFSFISDSSVNPANDTDWDDDVRTVAGIFGANASGKSNVVKALKFMSTAVTSSYELWASRDSIPINSFALESSLNEEPSLFEIVFQWEKTRYQYGFRLTKKRVVNEWLYAYATHRRQVWFERDADADAEEEWYFGKSFTGRNRVISDLTRPTTLFLSAAAANNHKLASAVAHFIRAHVNAALPEDSYGRNAYTRSMSSDEGRWNSVVDLMRFADLGISSARVRHETWDSKQQRAFTKMFRAATDEDVPDEEITKLIDSVSDTVEFGHSSGVDREPTYLPFNAESLGTQTLFALAGPIIRAISNGDILIIDEIDASLHPRLTCEIVRIFKNPGENPKQAQLIFTSHDTTLLGGLLEQAGLARDEVWFTEKKPDGATTLYPLTDFSPRKTENLERGYLQGRYGAVPYLNRSFLSDSVKRESEQVSTGLEHDDPESGLDISGVR